MCKDLEDGTSSTHNFFCDYFAYNTNNDNNTIKQLTDTILQLQKQRKKYI